MIRRAAYEACAHMIYTVDVSNVGLIWKVVSYSNSSFVVICVTTISHHYIA